MRETGVWLWDLYHAQQQANSVTVSVAITHGSVSVCSSVCHTACVCSCCMWSVIVWMSVDTSTCQLSQAAVVCWLLWDEATLLMPTSTSSTIYVPSYQVLLPALTHSLIGMLTDWLVDWLNWVVGWLVGWLIDWFIYWLIDSLIHWLTDGLSCGFMLQWKSRGKSYLVIEWQQQWPWTTLRVTLAAWNLSAETCAVSVGLSLCLSVTLYLPVCRCVVVEWLHSRFL